MPALARLDGAKENESTSIFATIWRALYYILFLPFSLFESDSDAHKAGIFRRAHAATVYQQEMGVIGGNTPGAGGADDGRVRYPRPPGPIPLLCKLFLQPLPPLPRPALDTQSFAHWVAYPAPRGFL